MFRDVPECSRMFHVPGFIDGPLQTRMVCRDSVCVFFGTIRKRICDLRSFGSCRMKGTDESILDNDSSVPFMRHDPNDLRSQIRFRILPKRRTQILFTTERSSKTPPTTFAAGKNWTKSI